MNPESIVIGALGTLLVLCALYAIGAGLVRWCQAPRRGRRY